MRIANFASAKPLGTVGGFSDVSAPANTLGTTPAHTGGGTGRFSFTQLDACATGTTVDAIRAFYAQHLVSAGWAQTETYPYNGQYQAPCGDPYCWAKDAAPRYVSLEKVTASSGGAVTFHLRLGTPPAAPNCPSSPFGSPPYKLTYNNTDIPLPPLSLIGPGDGSGGLTNSAMCSAGDASSINSFYQTVLPQLGFHQGTLPASDDCGGPHPWSAWVKGNEGVAWSVTPGGSFNPGWGWSITYCS